MNEIEAIKEATVLQAKFTRALISAITFTTEMIIEEIRRKGSTGFNAGFAAKTFATDFGLLSDQIREHWDFLEKQAEGKDEPET